MIGYQDGCTNNAHQVTPNLKSSLTDSHNIWWLFSDLQLFKQVADTEDESTEEVKTPQPMPESAPQPVPVAQQVGLRQEQNSWQEAVNYLGFSNKQQAAGYELLLGQVAEAKWVMLKSLNFKTHYIE